jgi:predicted O-methyltransferase YrrM
LVEVGSFQGKSTVLMGHVLRSFYPQSKIYAIDPHNGLVGAEDQGLQQLPASLEKFTIHIANEQLCDVVELIKEHSYNVAWNRPITFLFIDGLHDYRNVSKDFHHFSSWIRKGGYIAFHDYAHYYPGVMAFVDELLTTGRYRRVQLAVSLMVLQKL